VRCIGLAGLPATVALQYRAGRAQVGATFVCFYSWIVSFEKFSDSVDAFCHRYSALSWIGISSAQYTSFSTVALNAYRPGEVTAADLDQLRSIDVALKTLLRKDGACECDCEECLAGDCEDCSNPDCEDPNCEGSVKPRQDAEDLKLLKAFAIELKGSTG
jgi:hypothetical protein